jgi:hypothetical protein
MPVQQDDYALVIGINDYPLFKPLTGAVDDAKDFHEWLLDNEMGGGLPEKNCKLVLSTPQPLKPLQDDIDEKLAEIIQQIGANRARRFYLYFSGHGLGEKYSETALCLAKWSQLWRKNALDVKAYGDFFAESGRFKEVAIFLDCCRTRLIGAAGHEPLLDWVKPDNAAGGTRTFIAYATEFQNPAYEAAVGLDRDLVRGYFTRALLSALRGGAAVVGGGVPASELKKYLELHTPRLARENKQEQKPQVDNGFDAINEPRFGSALPEANVRITFSPERAGMIVLEDKDVNVIRSDDAPTGPWLVAVPAGINLIREVNTGQSQVITIGAAKEVTDVVF